MFPLYNADLIRPPVAPEISLYLTVLHPTWIPGSEVEVGEVDHVVVALPLLVEEPDLSRPPHHVVGYHPLQSKVSEQAALQIKQKHRYLRLYARPSLWDVSTHA